MHVADVECNGAQRQFRETSHKIEMIEVGRQTEVGIAAALVGGQHQLTQLNLESYQAKALCLVALGICRTEEKHIILAAALLTLDALDERWQLFEVGWITIDERCTAIVPPVNANTTGELSRHTRHKPKCRRRPKHKRFPITARLDRERNAAYFTYLRFPENVRRMIYSTNWVERLNRCYKRTLLMRGTMPSLASVVYLLGSVAKEKTEGTYARRLPYFREWKIK